MEIEQLCRFAVDAKASDIFIKSGSPPALRVNGRIMPTDLPTLDDADTERLALSVMSPGQAEAFKGYHELDLAFSIAEVARFRCNIYMQRGAHAMVLRIVPFEILSIEEWVCQARSPIWCCTNKASCWSPVPRAAASPRPWRP